MAHLLLAGFLEYDFFHNPVAPQTSVCYACRMVTQTCQACGQPKELETGFFRNSAKTSGYDAKCKACRGARAKKYRQIHAVEIAEQRKKYYLDNKESIMANKLAYYADNADRILQQKTEYWRNNKISIKKRADKWRKKNKSLLRDSTKQYRDAITRSIVFLLGGKCAMCGESEIEFLTIDHINNDGNSERSMGAVGWKRRILDGSADASRYRVLCHNCNLGRYRLDPVHHFKNRPHVGKDRLCPVCRLNKDESLFKSGHSRKCLDCVRLAQTNRRRVMIQKLGGACECCGLNEWHKLVVDHVHDDGAAARMSGVRGGIDILAAIVRGDLKRSDHQLLCWNCNYSKHRGSGLCLHQRNGTSILGGVTPTVRNTRAETLKTIEFEPRNVHVRLTDLEAAKPFLAANHYAGFGRPSSLVYGAWLNGALIGAAKFAPPVRQGIAKTVGLADGQVLELDRFCIHPAYHAKNFASFFMARAIKMIAADRRKVKKLVSFADPRFGHSGVIYEASNWEHAGTTSRGYYYEDAEGREINKKTLYEFAKTKNMKERQCAEALGYKKVHTPPKIKFVYTIKR